MPYAMRRCVSPGQWRRGRCHEHLASREACSPVNVSAPHHTTIDQALAQQSLPSAFLLRAAARPDQVALREFGSEQYLTLGSWSARARAFAGGLAGLGIRRGDTVALLLTSRVEFHIADMGALLLGAVPFSLYAASPVSQLKEIGENARPRALAAARSR